jgi:hypothetical protein
MAGKFSTTGQENAVTASLTTVLDVVAATTVRPRIYDFTISCGGTPADNAIRWAVMRHTTANTGTSVTPTALDPADPAAVATSLENCSAEGTYTSGSELFDQTVNQRAAYRWVAAPDGELIVPASANNGVGIRVSHASYTGTADATIHFME